MGWLYARRKEYHTQRGISGCLEYRRGKWKSGQLLKVLRAKHLFPTLKGGDAVGGMITRGFSEVRGIPSGKQATDRT